MFIEGRGLAARWSWLVGGVCGVCGVLLLLLVVCYCRLMPRHHKSFDEQYLKENHTIREDHVYSSRDSCRAKHAEVGAQAQVQRPSSYAGDARRPPPPPRPPRAPLSVPSAAHPTQSAPGDRDQYASTTSALEAADGAEALKTRSLPAFLRPRSRPRPLSDADADAHLLYSKVSVSKKHRNRMRSEHAAIIALSKSRGALPAAERACDAIIVYDQRTRL